MTLRESSIKCLDQISKDHPERDKVDILIEMAESPRSYYSQSQPYYQTDQVACLLEAVKIMRQRMPKKEEK